MSELPKGWVNVELDLVCNKPQQRTPDANEAFTYIDIGSVDRDSKTITNPSEILGNEAPSRARKIVNKNDIIVSMTRPNLNAVALIPESLDEQIASTGFDVLKPILVEPKWLFAIVKSKAFIDEVSGETIGALYPACKASDIRGFKAPIPPLAEQKRIVGKLDQVLAQVDTIKARLDGIPAILKRFRQSVLAAAVSGKLTEEWRTLCLFSNINSNSFELKYTIPENFPRYEIPDTWVKSSIGNFCDFQQGMQIAKSDRFQEAGENRLPILRIGNYATGFTENVDYVDITYNSLIASEDDLILTRTGETRGLVLTGFRGVFHNNTFRINYNDSLITRSYLYFALQELRTQNYILEVSGRSAQPDLTHKKFGPCPISVPPLEEQTEIVRLVDQYFAFADTIEKQVQKAQQRVDKLTQSILAKAFRGELVPQDPTDEPADQLLKRIAAARTEAEVLAKAAKKVGKKK